MTKVILYEISKVYGKDTKAVDNVSFQADNGEFVVLVGPSGCGKTTILRMIAGLETISGGNLLFDDMLMNDLPPKSRDVGMVFQNYALYPHLTVFENIAFPLSVKKEKKEVIKSRTTEIADLLELGSLLERRPKELSGGQRQRVALGRALVRKPKVFLFDEPLSNLDAKLRVQMRTEIMQIQGRIGTTSIYVTHDQTEAMTMGSKLVVLDKGIVQQVAPPAVLYDNPANRFVAGFIGSPQMNFFEGTLTGNDSMIFREEGTGIEIRLSEKNFSNKNIKANSRVTIGIRPENIYPGRQEIANPAYYEAGVSNKEYLGNENLIYFKNTVEMKCCRTTSDVQDFKPGTKAIFTLDVAKILIFDVSGRRI
jgi:multiple sugar transport system ATP-binding protein